MIVYVETNFVFELAFQQEELSDCQELLELAAQKRIELVLPAYSMGEPYEKLIRRERERKRLSNLLSDELKELGRSASYSDDAERYAELISWLVESNEQESQRLESAQRRILSIATIIPTDHSVLLASLDARRNLGLSPQDSIVYAAVLQHVRGSSSPQCFINKNTRDFLDPHIASEFDKHDCKIIPTFTHGVKYVAAHLHKAVHGRK